MKPLVAFTPPELPTGAVSDVDAIAGISAVAPTQVGVVRWEPIAAKLFVGGTPVSEIAEYVKQDAATVQGFLSGRGRELIKGYVAERPARLVKMLDGAKVDVILTLLKLAKHAKMESAQVSACKVLLELADESNAKNPKTPEEIKRQAEEKIRKTLEQKAQSLSE